MTVFPAPNLLVTKIELACHMRRGFIPQFHHPNRPSWGLVLHNSPIAVYHFENGLSLTPDADELLLLPRGCSYRVEKIGDNEAYCINFQCDADPAAYSPMLLSIKDCAGFEALYAAAAEAWSEFRPGYTAFALGKLYELLAKLTEEQAQLYTGQSRLRRLDPAVQYILAHYTEELPDMEQLSSMCGMSDVYFRHLFHARFGTSPKRFITEQRISHAKELIRASLCTVESAGALSGFRDPSRFSKVFREVTGMSPLEYKNSLR